MTKIQGVLSDYELMEFQPANNFDPLHYYKTREQCPEFLKTVLTEIYERGVRDGMECVKEFIDKRK